MGSNCRTARSCLMGSGLDARTALLIMNPALAPQTVHLAMLAPISSCWTSRFLASRTPSRQGSAQSRTRSVRPHVAFGFHAPVRSCGPRSSTRPRSPADFGGFDDAAVMHGYVRGRFWRPHASVSQRPTHHVNGDLSALTRSSSSEDRSDDREEAEQQEKALLLTHEIEIANAVVGVRRKGATRWNCDVERHSPQQA